MTSAASCDPERIVRLQDAMKEAGLDALAVGLPIHVLLVAGYFPVVGHSFAIVTREGELTLFAPEDERDLADCHCDDSRIVFYRPRGLESLRREIAAHTPLGGKVVGFECGELYEEASYASMHLFLTAVPELLEGAVLRPAGELLARVKAVLTPIELDRVRRACRIAQAAFEAGGCRLAPGLKETEAAEGFRGPLVTIGTGFEGVQRVEGFVFCMSGPHSAEAWAAYARSRAREIEIADLVLVHCNSHADGYWTDITRTWCMGPVDERQCAMYEAVFAAREAAIAAVRPGASAAEVDRAGREVLQAAGFGNEFKHSTGHGVGFAAISHNARPRIAPDSPDRLEAGMVFNIEPAIYIEGYGGLRHCDMVAVTETGAEVLTPFQCRPEELMR
jgi:Xaa-Pro aminopeptidase